MGSIPVYEGIWTDWSHGVVYGSYLTLPSDQGRYLIAAVATFVVIVGSSIWTIVAYTFHQCAVHRSKGSMEMRHAQYQISYRNSQSAFGTLEEIFLLWAAYLPRNYLCCSRRKIPRKAPHSKIWTFAAIITPLFVLVAVTISSVLSSRIARPTFVSSDVKVRDGLCGIQLLDGTDDGRVALELKVLNDTIAARSYARTCYSKDALAFGTASCSSFTRQTLPYHKSTLTGCPFGTRQTIENLKEPFVGGECEILYNTGAHFMYTDLLDSHLDLGINAPRQDRIQFQKNVTCSPLKTAGRTHPYAGDLCPTGVNCSKTYSVYEFGEIEGLQDFTAFWDPLTKQESVGYQVSAFLSATGPITVWKPIAPLIRKDGDTSLFFINANSVQYRKQVLDPVYLAIYDLSGYQGALDRNKTYYQPFNEVSAIGCVDQYLVRNPNSDVDTGPQKIDDLSVKIADLGLNPVQYITAQRLVSNFRRSSTYSSVYGYGANALKATDKVLNLLSDGVPPEYWRIETEGWFETSLAKLQWYAVEYAANPGASANGYQLHFPDANTSTQHIWEEQCKNQKISNIGSYQTFSFFALMLLTTLGSVVILTSLLLKWIVSKARRRGGRDLCPTELAIIADDKYHLHRMTQEIHGNGVWVDCDEELPIAITEERALNPIAAGGMNKQERAVRYVKLTKNEEENVGQDESDLPQS